MKTAPWEIYICFPGVEEFYEAGTILERGEEAARKISRKYTSLDRACSTKFYVRGELKSQWINGRKA